ncbi:hypothetical protein ACEXQB_013020 [Herbiconiux sp. P18]|uniref:hypothetical protein n=1 Tax=Herbiconiux liangxiaofengii TaxID=3342795 RepID=UPI0035BACE1B
MSTTTSPSSSRRRFAALIAGFAVLLAVVSFIPAQSASARGCVLGPSLGAAAKAAGVSCPDVEGNGSTGGESGAWGPANGGCKFGWDASQLPAGMLDFLDRGSAFHNEYPSTGGSRITTTTYRREGKTVGQVSVHYYPSDKTFIMTINVYGRAGNKSEFAYFDCADSRDGAMYDNIPGSPTIVMSAPGTAVPVGVEGYVETRGTITAVPDGRYLLRIDVTNTGSQEGFADVYLGLNGYSVDSVVSLPRVARCAPYQGLMCTFDTLLPGQTLSMLIAVRAEGDDSVTSAIDVDVTALGRKKVADDVGSAPVNRTVVTQNLYQVLRP